jgi:hypothetical protein
MKYFSLLCLVCLIFSCNDARDTHTKSPVTACETVLQKLRECIGAEVVLVGECTETSAKDLLDLECMDLLNAVGIISSTQPYAKDRRV